MYILPVYKKCVRVIVYTYVFYFCIAQDVDMKGVALKLLRGRFSCSGIRMVGGAYHDIPSWDGPTCPTCPHWAQCFRPIETNDQVLSLLEDVEVQARTANTALALKVSEDPRP